MSHAVKNTPQIPVGRNWRPGDSDPLAVKAKESSGKKGTKHVKHHSSPAPAPDEYETSGGSTRGEGCGGTGRGRSDTGPDSTDDGGGCGSVGSRRTDSGPDSTDDGGGCGSYGGGGYDDGPDSTNDGGYC